MSSISNYTRSTMLLTNQQFLASLGRTQSQLLDVQQQMSSGKQFSKPGQAPDKTSAVLYLQQALAAREQQDQNLQQASGMLNNIDNAFADANSTVLQAQTTALSQIGIGSDPLTRGSESEVIDGQLKALMQIANRQYDGVALFGGDAGLPQDGQVFQSFLGGVRYLGSDSNLTTTGSELANAQINSNGVDAFGALSARVASQVPLDPQASADTHIVDVAGATNEGVRLGTVLLTVDGTAVSVDLSTADTLGDVVKRVNNAIDTIDSTAGSLALAGPGFSLNSTAGHTLSIVEVGAGATAGDLGIQLSSTGGVADLGPGVNRKLTATTRLGDLGATVDWTSGLQITQGGVTKVADFSSDQTIQDLQNTIDQLNLGLRLEINDEGTALNLVSEVSGVSLAIGENGGTTARDLGLTTYGSDTSLSNFRHGLGIDVIPGENDFQVSLHDGDSFQVNLDGALTVGDVIDAVQTAAAAAGIAPADFDIALASNGTGMVFTDNTTGGNDFAVTNLGQSLAATQLGIDKNAGGTTTFTGEDRATVRVDNVFTHMIDLRDALTKNDESGISIAGSELEDDLGRLAEARASVGVAGQRVQQALNQSADQKLAEQMMLSNLQDADMASVITRYTTLSQQLALSLKAGAQNMQMSLMDYLR